MKISKFRPRKDSAEEEVFENTKYSDSICYDASYFGVDELGNLIGAVFRTSNKALRIKNERTSHHPTVIHSTGDGLDVFYSQGTGYDGLVERYAQLYPVIIEPDGENGLDKTTAFAVRLRRVSYRKLYRSDLLGKLSQDDMARLTRAILGRK